MLLPLAENMSRSNPLGQNLIGIVVENKDPENLRRIKVKCQTIYEFKNAEDAPWVYPKRNPDGGGRGDTSSSDVPEVGTQVLLSWPTGDIYYCQYDGIPTTPQSTQGLFNKNPVPEAPKDELHIPSKEGGGGGNSSATASGGGSSGGGGGLGDSDDYGQDTSDGAVDPGKSIQSAMFGKVWTNLTSAGKKALSWMRFDKNQGIMELFQGSAKGNNGAQYGSLFRMDRSGNLQIHVPGNLDWVVHGNATMNFKKMLQHSVDGNHFHNTKGDHVTRVGGAQTSKVAGDHDTSVGGNSGNTIQKQHGRTAQKIMDNSGYKPGTVEQKDGDHDKQLEKLQERGQTLDKKLAALQQQHDDMIQDGGKEGPRLAQLSQTMTGDSIG